MAKGLVSDTNLTAIANAIRAKNGSSDTYTPAEMATAITNIPTSQVDEQSALKWMLENRTDYSGIAAGLTTLTALPTFTQPSGITNFSHAFDGCSALTSVSRVDFSSLSSASNVDYMFNGCSSLTGTIDVRNAGQGGPYMFNGCSNIRKAFFVKTTSSTGSKYDYSNMFAGCTNLTNFGNYSDSRQNVINWTTCNYANETFRDCSSITTVTINAIGTSMSSGRTPGVNAQSMFLRCTALKTVTIATDALKNILYANTMFQGCSSLETISSWSMPNLTQQSALNSMFSNCTSLSNDSLNNILASLATATSYTGTKTLKKIGLTSTQATTCTGLSNWAALSAAGWTTGY